MTGAPPAAPVLVSVGSATTPVPFEGGTFAAFPILALAAHPSGQLALAVPPGPGTLALTMQCVVPDAAQPEGFAPANALEHVY